MRFLAAVVGASAAAARRAGARSHSLANENGPRLWFFVRGAFACERALRLAHHLASDAIGRDSLWWPAHRQSVRANLAACSIWPASAICFLRSQLCGRPEKCWRNQDRNRPSIGFGTPASGPLISRSNLNHHPRAAGHCCQRTFLFATSHCLPWPTIPSFVVLRLSRSKLGGFLGCRFFGERSEILLVLRGPGALPQMQSNR